MRDLAVARVSDPQKLKHYELENPLGEGGMGVVYRAKDTRLGRTVAIKMLPRKLTDDEERSRRFEREARIVSAVNHPNIATLYDVDRDGDTAFLIMELVEGLNLRQLMRRGPVPMEQVVEGGVQIADALWAAHKQGVVHRDLKPENVMASESGYFKVLDFGIARFEDTAAPADDPASNTTQTPTRTWATRAGDLVGTVAYMSPEQAMGEVVDARSDIFSLGSLLYELATGKPAFSGKNEFATVQAINLTDPAPMREIRSEIPVELEMIVMRCLAKQPEQRYGSAEELAADLRALRSGELTTSHLRRAQRAASAAGAGGGSSKMWRAVAGVAALALVAVAAVWAIPRLRGNPATDIEQAEPMRLRTEGIQTPGATPRPHTPPGLGPAGRFGDTSLTVQNGGLPRVVVAFFENNSGDQDVDWLARGLPEMLTTDLSRSTKLDVIATQRLYDLMAAAGKPTDQPLDRSVAAELARWAGADLVIHGSLVKAGDTYRIDVQAQDVRTGSVAVAHKVQGQDIFSMVSELTQGVLDGLDMSTVEGDAPTLMAGVAGPGLTASPEAYRLFVKGKTLFDKLYFDEASEAFQQSLTHDPEFALANLHMGMLRQLEGQPDSARQHLELAARHGERLPESKRLLAEAMTAIFIEHDMDRAEMLSAKLQQQHPGKEDTQIWIGQACQAEGKPLDAIRNLRESLARDPNNLLATATLADVLAQLGEVESAGGILMDAMKRHPESEQAIHERMDRMKETGG